MYEKVIPVKMDEKNFTRRNMDYLARIMNAVFLLLLWKAYLASGNENLFKAYYNENFITFTEKMNSINHKSMIWEIFNHLETTNSTHICIQHLKNYQDSISGHVKWAIEFLDSSGSSSTGWLSGNTICLGDYHQCLSASPENFTSTYCLVNINISNNKKKNVPWVPHNVPIVFSLCVPSTCSEKQLELVLQHTNFLNNATVTVECQSKRLDFSLGDGVTIAVYILIWVLIISTTIPKKWIPISRECLLAFLESFNLRKNLSYLLKTNDQINLLSSLHGLRVLSQCSIIWYHIIVSELMVNYPALNKFYFNTVFRTWKGAIDIELVLAVDTFFVIGGILLTWNGLEKKKKFNMIEYYIHRYLRLTPPYMAVLLLISTFSNKLCKGPLCKYTIDREKQYCSSYWWTNILYINNIYPGILKSVSQYIECMPHTWYLAADWQLFFFISPLVVLVMNKWSQHLLKLITSIFFISIVSSFMVSYLYQIPTDNLMFSSYEEANRYYNKLYATPFARAGPWAIGMFFGVILHNFKNNPVKLPKNLRLLAWLFTIVGLCLSVELDLPFLRQQPNIGARGVWSALFNATQRNIWAVSICWIIFSSGTQKAGPIGNFLCWSVFQPLAKLSYSAYLIHKLIISLYFGETYGYNYISATSVIPLVLGIIFITYIAALLLYLSFEVPVGHLFNFIFRKETSSLEGQSRNGMEERSLELESCSKKKSDNQDKD